MIIGIDIDGTLNDNFDFLVRHANNFFGKRIVSDSWDWNLAELFQVSDIEADSFWSYIEKDFYSKPMPRLGASQALTNLKQMKFEIAIITARDAQYHRTTQLWLEQHSLPYDYLLMTNDKYQACMNINAKVMIDDSPEYASLSKEIPLVMFEHPYNRHVQGANIYHVQNWSQVINLIKDIFRK